MPRMPKLKNLNHEGHEEKLKNSEVRRQESEFRIFTNERSTSNVQRRISNKIPALFLHSTFDVERCMFTLLNKS